MAKILISHDCRMVIIESDIFQVAGCEECQRYMKNSGYNHLPLEIISKAEMDMAYETLGKEVAK